MTSSLRQHALRFALVLFVLTLAPLVAHAQGENNETRLICNSDPIPTGYIRTNIVVNNSDPRCANSPFGTQIPNMAVIRRFYTKPIHFVLTVCANINLSPLPLGWVEQSGPFFNGFNFCGSGTSSSFPNARTIRRVTEHSIDDARAFVYYHYMDFLAREPDQGGWDHWTNQITQCGTNQGCIDGMRVNVSKAFFESIEFSNSGFYAYRMYKAAFGRLIRFGEFQTDTKTLTNGVVVGSPGWEQRMSDNKDNYNFAFVNRQDFRNIYQTMSNTQFVDRLFQNAGFMDFTERQRLLNLLNGGTPRYLVLRQFIEFSTFHDREYNSNFVLSSYFGYLRRNPDDAPDFSMDGYNFWLNSLNASGPYPTSDYWHNIAAFINSTEYRGRFGQ